MSDDDDLPWSAHVLAGRRDGVYVRRQAGSDLGSSGPVSVVVFVVEEERLYGQCLRESVSHVPQIRGTAIPAMNEDDWSLVRLQSGNRTVVGRHFCTARTCS